MKTDPNEPATAQVVTSAYPEWNPNRHFGGLSIRELFAMTFAAARLNGNIAIGFKSVKMEDAVSDADALIAALNEKGSE